MNTTERKLTKGEYRAELLLSRFVRTDGVTNPCDGILLLNGRVVDDAEVTGGFHCLKLTVGTVVFGFTTADLSDAGVTARGFPLVMCDRGHHVELRFLSDCTTSTFAELAESMYD